ncbi:MAG: hypothetical protein R2839_08745 [Thermomicrobiales bacterium]
MTQVDEEAKQQAIQEISDVHEETVEELRARAEREISELAESTGTRIETLTEGKRSRGRNAIATTREAKPEELNGGVRKSS